MTFWGIPMATKISQYRQSQGWETAYCADKSAIKTPRYRRPRRSDEDRKNHRDLTGWAYFSLYSLSLLATLAYFYYLNSDSISSMLFGTPSKPATEEAAQ